MWSAYEGLAGAGYDALRPACAWAVTTTGQRSSTVATAEKQPHSRGRGSYRLAVTTDGTEFKSLEQPWKELFERAGRPCQLFQSFDWLTRWADHYLDARIRLSIVTGWRDGRLVLVWPLVISRAAGLTRLSWMGEPVSQYGDVLVEDGPEGADLLRRSWDWIKALDADVIHLRKIRAGSSISALLSEIGAVRTSTSRAPYLDLTSAPDFEIYNRRYPAKRRSDRRRRLRRLTETGRITFEQHACGRVAEDLVSRALLLKRAWLVERGLIFPILHDNRFERFFRDVLAAPTRSFAARISAIRCNGEPIGVEISFSCKGDIFGVLISHDLNFEKQGLGAVLAEYSIRTAHEAGYGQFDLLAPAEPYKMDWADGSVEVADWALPLSPAGAVYTRVWLRGARHWARKAAYGLPPRLGRMLWAMYQKAGRINAQGD